MALAWNTEAANNGRTGASTKDYDIYAQIWLDDTTTNPDESSAPSGVIDDGKGSYINDVDRVMARVGATRDIYLHLNTQTKRTAIRHLMLNGGFPEFVAPAFLPQNCNPSGLSPTGERPVFNSDEVRIGFLQIFGNDIDDQPPGVGVVRHLDARWVFGDDAGRTWTVYFGAWPIFTGSNDSTGFVYAPCGSCMQVERLVTGSDKSRWRFWTEGQGPNHLHVGYLYYYPGDPTAPQVFAGIVSLPISGTVESLTSEPTPLPSEGYNPGDGSLTCPLQP